MHLFFDHIIRPESKLHQLSEEESKHACRVLRLKIGDQIELLNGDGYRFLGEIVSDNPKRCEISILNHSKEEPTSYYIHLAIAPTKNIDRIEWMLEKAVEIGVHEISFLTCKNSERKQIKLDRLEKIAISAMKQSQRTYLTKINDIRNFKEFILSNPNGLIAHCMDSEKKTLPELIQPKNQVILIGPEGDFDSSEIAFAFQNGYNAISLGKTRLRTETAGLFAVFQAIQHFNT